LIRRNSFFESDTVGSVIPDLDYPTSYSYTIMPDHDTKFDDTIPTDALGGDQPGIIPDLKQEAMTSKMRSDFRSIIEMLNGPEPTDGLPAQMRKDFRALTEAMGGKDEYEAFKEAMTALAHNLTKAEADRLQQEFAQPLTEAQLVYLESIKSDLKGKDKKEEIEAVLSKIEAKQNPPLLLKIIKSISLLLAGGVTLGLLTKFGGWGKIFTWIDGMFGGSVMAAIKGAVAFVGVVFGIELGVILEFVSLDWLLTKLTNMIFKTNYATDGEKVRSYKKFIDIMDENIKIARKANKEDKAKMFERLRQDAIEKLKNERAIS